MTGYTMYAYRKKIWDLSNYVDIWNAFEKYAQARKYYDYDNLKKLSDNFATSLHVYAKPYEECEIFDIEKGTITKAKMDYYSIDSVLCTQ